MLDLGPTKKENLSESISKVLDKALVAHNKAKYEAYRGSGTGEVAAKRIGAGYVGVECARALAFKFHKTTPDERESVVSPGELNRHAESGHWTEEKTCDWLRLCGFDVSTNQIDRETGEALVGYDGGPKQHGFYNAQHPETGQYQLAGEVDGIIISVPDDLKHLIPVEDGTIWESKKATHKKWTNFKKKGVKDADPKYYGQIQVCMAYMGAKRCLFSMLNLDNMKFYWELVKFDQAKAQKLSDRAVSVIQSNNPFELPRAVSDQTHFVCRFCDYQTSCWNEPEAVKKVDTGSTPSWLNK